MGEHPVLTALAIAGAANPIGGGVALWGGVYGAVHDGVGAYQRSGLGGLAGYAATEVGIALATDAVGGAAAEGLGWAARGLPRLGPMLREAALAPMWMAMGAGGPGGAGRGPTVKVGRTFLEKVLESAGRPAGPVQSEALRKLQRRIGDPEGLGLFNGVPLTEDAAQGLVRSIMSNATTEQFGRLGLAGYRGEMGIAYFDASGRGVLVRKSDGLFITFLEGGRGFETIFN